MEDKFKNKKSGLAKKEDIAQIRVEMSDQRAELLRAVYFTSAGNFIAVVADVSGIIFAVLKFGGLGH